MSEGVVAADQLRLFIERIERLEEEKKGIADDIRDVYAEAKANGYDTKTMRKVVRLRRLGDPYPPGGRRLARNLSRGARVGVRKRGLFGAPKKYHGRPFQVQEHHAPQGRAG